MSCHARATTDWNGWNDPGRIGLRLGWFALRWDEIECTKLVDFTLQAGHAGSIPVTRSTKPQVRGLWPAETILTSRVRLGISRSEFFSTAARRYLDELAHESLTHQIDQALDLPGHDDDASAVAASAGRAQLSEDDW